MPGGGQSGLGGSGVAAPTTSPWNSALQGATAGVGWVGSHIPFIHHGGQSTQAPMPGTGQGTSGTPQYDDYGRITGYTPTQTNAPSATPNIPAQPNTGGLDLHTLWNVLSQMGLFSGTVGAPPPAASPSADTGSPVNTSTGTLPNQSLISFIANMLGIQVAPPSAAPNATASIPMPGQSHDGAGGVTYATSATDNQQNGYWGTTQGDASWGGGSAGFGFGPRNAPMPVPSKIRL